MPNQFEHYAQLGYTKLVPIVPHDAPISERSSLFKRVGTKQDGRGKTPGIKGQDGRWFGLDWLPYEADARDFTRWHAMGAGLGIKTGHGLVAIDADTFDKTLAQTIHDAVKERFGLLPVRIGNNPKALYVIRVSAPFQYARVEFGERNETGRLLERVEILSDGRQFVAEGIHPKTKQPYRWPRPLPPLAELPTTTPEELTAFLEHLRQILPQAADIIKEGATTEVAQESLRGNLELVRKAVEATPNTSALFPSRESYRDMGYAIKAALPDDQDAAFDIFSDWCDRWTDGENDPEIVSADWRRMKPPYRRGASWLYELAEQHSHGEFTQAQVWFDPIPETSASPFDIQAQAERAERTGDVYQVLSIEDIKNRPAPEWLIKRHLPKVGMGFLYSEPGVGKSFLALDMALHIAYGRPEWHGDTIAADPDAVVIYLAAEGSYGFRNRVRAWLKDRGRPGEQGERFRLIEQTVNFMAPEDIDRLLRTVRIAVGHRPCLIVVDTVSRAMPGADENLQKEMTLFVRACDALRDAFGCVVLGVHHAGKSGDMRGSTVLNGAGDFVFRMRREKGAKLGTLFCEKMKEGVDGWEDTYRTETVDLGCGETSLVLMREASVFGPEIDITPEISDSILVAIRAAWDAGKPWAKGAKARERYGVRRLVVDFGVPGDKAEQLLGAWEALGVLHYETYDKKHRLDGYKVAGVLDRLSAREGIFD